MTAKEHQCLQENSPCKLFFVSKRAAVAAILAVVIPLGGSVGGLIWKASAYAARIENLTIEVQTMRGETATVIGVLEKIDMTSSENNRLLKQNQWRWRPQP